MTTFIDRTFNNESEIRSFIMQTHRILTVSEDKYGHEKYFVAKREDEEVFTTFIVIEYLHMTEAVDFNTLADAMTYMLTTQFCTYLNINNEDEGLLAAQLSENLRGYAKQQVLNRLFNSKDERAKTLIAAL